jgi:hypothetical protein
MLLQIEKYLLFLLLLLASTACVRYGDPEALRNATARDPAQYFEDDHLRSSTLIACKAGTPEQQLQWAKLAACQTALRTDSAKRAGWSPQAK